MSIINVPTNFNIDLEFETPEFFRRFLAWLVDMMIQICYLVLALRVYVSYAAINASADTAENIPWIIRIIIWPVIIYHIVLEVTMNGQSIGKKIFGLRVVNENGGRASISQFLIRCLIRTSDFMLFYILIRFVFSDGSLLGLGLSILLLVTDIVLIASTPKNQRLGDMIAHTILVKTNPRGNMNETIFLEVEENYIPKFPQIMQLNDRDINAIKNILDTARKKGDFQLAATATEKIKNHLKIETSMHPMDFLEVLLRDYNYLSVH